MTRQKRFRFIMMLVTMSVLLLQSGPVAAGDIQPHTLTVITVSAGDVEALYDAVYENGQPRNNADIVLGAGTYVLDKNEINGGRLVLGENTVLRSTLVMATDANGVHLVNEDNEPIVQEDGAIIDGSGLIPEAVGEGIIMVGDNGSVEKFWLAGGARPGVVITFEGMASHVASTDHTIGFQVRAVGEEAQATLEKNLAAGNSILGMSLLSLDPAFHPTDTGAEVQVEVRYSASVNNDSVNMGVFGAVGGTTNSEIDVEASHNVFRGGATLGNIRVVGGQNVFPFTGSNNNEVKVELVDNEIANTEVGLKVEGGNLVFRPLPLEERQSSNNEAKVSIFGNAFDSNIVDIRVYGSVSLTGEPGGDHNEAKVDIEDGDPETLTIEVQDCFPEDAFPTCTSEAKVE